MVVDGLETGCSHCACLMRSRRGRGKGESREDESLGCELCRWVRVSSNDRSSLCVLSQPMSDRKTMISHAADEARVREESGVDYRIPPINSNTTYNTVTVATLPLYPLALRHTPFQSQGRGRSFILCLSTNSCSSLDALISLCFPLLVCVDIASSSPSLLLCCLLLDDDTESITPRACWD